jgi:leader peptidase (prepilin peptidase) / N-methyltransferase
MCAILEDMDAAGWIVTAALAVAGLTAGCWLTMLAARVPRGESLRLPAGRCAACGSPAGAADLIPLLGWVRLRRRCGECRLAFGYWYPAAGLVTAAALIAMWLRFGASPELAPFCYLAVVGVALAFVDARYQRLPDLLTLPSYPVAVAALGVSALFTPGGGRHFGYALIGMAAVWLFFLLQVLIYPAGMGWGDVKLSGLIGLYLGWFGAGAVLAGLLGGYLLAAVTGLGLIAARRATRKSRLPFGPFMLASALAVIVIPALSR